MTGLQITVSRTDQKVRNVLTAEYAKVRDMNEYLTKLVDGAKLEGMSKNGEIATYLINGHKINLVSNYDLRKILKKRSPKKDLLDLANFIKPVIQISNKQETVVSKPKIQSAATGSLIPLKRLCQQYELEPRKARAALRAAIARGDVAHAPGQRWEWADNSDQLPKVRKVLEKLS